MRNMLIVSEVKNFLCMSIKARFESIPYKVNMVPGDMEVINEIEDTFDCILIYLDDKLLQEQQKALYYLKDKALADDLPIFIIGNSEELAAIKTIIPKHIISKEITRPFVVNEVAESIEKFMKQYSTQVKKKILVVDDSGTMLRSIKSWLEDKYNVFLANSGAMAIKYVTLNRPDLILLDYEMPVVDGKQVLEMIRTETEFAEIPVVFLTNKGDNESIMRVKELKPEGYLLKSMEAFEIVKAIDDFFIQRKGLL